MYFENRINLFVKKESLKEIADIFFNKEFISNHAYQFEDFVFIDDSSPSGTGIPEVAIINIKSSSIIESISIWWDIKSAKTLLKYFKSAIEENTPLRKVIIPTQESNHSNLIVSLTCSCCGNDFTDWLSNQIEFDQDDGSGLCDECQNL